MKVTIQVGGRFHAFNLAYQLEKRGYYLAYPKERANSGSGV